MKLNGLLVVGILVLAVNARTDAQSFELMAGNERIFIDAQYLKYFDDNYKWSLFSRARATTSYSEKATDLFTAVYLNNTFKSGLGVSAVGRISSLGSGVDVGMHYLKKRKDWTIFILPSINLNDELLYSWFSIIRYEPSISDKAKLYTSYEQFSAFNGDGHITSVQRLRLGIQKFSFIGGIAANFRESLNDFSVFDSNIGIFIKKEF